MIEQRQKIYNFCAQMVNFHQPDHIFVLYILCFIILPMVFCTQQHYKKMAQLVSEKRELYRDKLQSLLQSVTTTLPDDLVQQETEEYGDFRCSNDVPCDGEGEQFEYNNDGEY